MNNVRSVRPIELIYLVVLLAAGCRASSTPADAPDGDVTQPSGPAQVTLYVAGMNQRLKVL